MIAKRKTELIQNGTWQAASSAERPSPAVSLKDRLASLNDSAKDWQKRVSSPVASLNATPRRFTRAAPSSVLKELPLSTNRKASNISSGVNKFFNEAGASTKMVDDDIDLDALATCTPTLTIPTRAKAPTRNKGRKCLRDERMDFNQVKIDESQFAEEPEVEAKVIDTQEEAIRALKDTKKILKSPIRKCPYPDVMVIQVRGSKVMDVRLVAPSVSSIHEFGCFIIVTRSELIKYEGAYANILEKTKATQICIDVISRSDLSCKAEKTLEIKGPDNTHSLRRLLKGDENETKKDDDCLNNSFESLAAQLNLVIRINDDHSVQSLGKAERFSISLLQPKQTLIFDFGSEIYVWSGRDASKVNGAYAQEFAKQLLDKSVNSSERIVGEAIGSPRPSWVLSRRVFQGVQDILFKSKFSDWESKEMLLTTCRPSPRISPNCIPTPKRRHVHQDPASIARRMKESEAQQPMTTLEDQEITRNLDEVISEELALWHLDGETLSELPFTSIFMSNKCYVIRWKYRIQKVGIRRLKTGRVEDRETGRTRIAFFYWLGDRTLPKQHGICALRIKDLDKDNSPRIRIVQGSEPSLFLSLFKTSFIVRNEGGEEQPMLCVLGGTEEETHLCEVDSNQPLRSHAVYLHYKMNKPVIVAGAGCSKDLVRFAFKHTDNMTESDVEISVEGDDTNLKWIKSSRREKAMRAWRLYEAEIEALSFPHDHPSCAFTFDQKNLVDTIIVDVGDQLWVWSETVISTQALKVAFEYWKERKGAAAVVHKGAEPDEFKALFMQWNPFEAAEKPMRPRNLKTLLDERCRSFSLEDLKERKNLPEGMDMRQLEEYLTENEFETTFKMNRDSFYAIPEWKQIEMRKSLGLF